MTEQSFELEDIELESALEKIWNIALEFHLDPFPTNFEVVPPRIMNEIGSTGLPDRFSHWTHGRAYRQLKTMYDYGLSKIYELVINSNPSIAFLLENNPPIENKFIMAHVLGHTDFFKNNRMFAATRRDMNSAAGQNAQRIQQHEKNEGVGEVEQILDAVLAIQEHIDPYLLHRPSADEELRIWREEAERQKKVIAAGSGDEFDDILGPKKRSQSPSKTGGGTFPPEPDKDLLGFIRNYAPYLMDWERDIVDIVRGESVYFWPQRRTKIMNEGWASYWHKRLMRVMADRNHVTAAENEVWWKLHSGVVAPNPRQLNPYYLGMKIYEYVEDYYNGNLSETETAWLRKEDLPVYPQFTGELQDSPGLAKIRDIMIHDDDQSFIRNYFDRNVADRMALYIYEEEEMSNGDKVYTVKEKGWQEIRQSLVDSMDNCGDPYIVVLDGNYQRQQELFLEHRHDGRDLDKEYLQKTLPYIHLLWRRPVHLMTEVDGENIVYSYDGAEITTTP